MSLFFGRLFVNYYDICISFLKEKGERDSKNLLFIENEKKKI
jgi:hypothetical protein